MTLSLGKSYTSGIAAVLDEYPLSLHGLAQPEVRNEYDMKTERRHDLETNDLARHTAEWIEKLKPHTSQIFGTVLAVAGVLILVYLWTSTSDSQEQAAWTDYALAIESDDPDAFDLQKVATNEAYAGTSMQEWASAAWADLQTAVATQTFLRDRESAEQRLSEAEPVYLELIQSAKDEQIRNRAHYGLGRVYQMLDRLDEAQEHFDSVGGDYQAIAQARAEQLLDPEFQDACKWLATAELPKREPTGVSGDKPAFEAELPDAGGVSARSLEDILGFTGGDDDRYGDQGPEEGELDEIFQEEQSETETPAESSGEEESTQEVEAETDAESIEP